ncbi:hypothetical protein COCSADRAFT_273223 [Bipolaris sorokiniana ND90Pr]|uniref:Uncharacterized protein n=1 Tax=Cochliobolus sativus (strain ND90Pr / ATCC 201652) TaxID=665912 RepID=M2SMU5_COCSN|nr:uncharacterized protein COCSADRAFT_273223 [Bipolaris sorokiniana ND90Pr]EMD68493.1 hypothetical protein COCSADRAFT_273223 [Bipolaris sorokiniana ND90Pr]
MVITDTVARTFRTRCNLLGISSSIVWCSYQSILALVWAPAISIIGSTSMVYEVMK